jgi:hypothetical protein
MIEIALSLIVALAGFSAPLVDRNRPYDEQVAQVRFLIQQGAVRSFKSSSHGMPTLEAASSFLASSSMGRHRLPKAIATALEERWVWGRFGQFAPGSSTRAFFYIDNPTEFVVSGIVIEISDADCEFRATAKKTYIVTTFESPGILKPNEAAVFDAQIPIPKYMFENGAGGLTCGTIVGVF